MYSEKSSYMEKYTILILLTVMHIPSFSSNYMQRKNTCPTEVLFFKVRIFNFFFNIQCCIMVEKTPLHPETVQTL